MADVTVTRAGGLTIASFEPNQLGIVISPREGRTVFPMSAADVIAADSTVVAALDGPMFETCDDLSYARSQCADLDYVHQDARAGVRYASDPDKATRGITISAMPNGSSIAEIGGDIPLGAIASVQMYPTLVYDGFVQSVSTSGSNANTLWRAAFAQMRDGRLAFIVGRDSLLGFARSLAAAGVYAAGYTDGGGSALLLADGNRFGSTENRRVASWIVARSKSSVRPSLVAPILVGAAVVATVGVFSYKPSRERIFKSFREMRKRLGA